MRQHASACPPVTNYAKDYAKELHRWACGINGKHKIPMVSARLFRMGEAARPGHGERLRAIVTLYRREYEAIGEGIQWRQDEAVSKDKVAAVSKDKVASEGEAGGMPLTVRCCGVWTTGRAIRIL